MIRGICSIQPWYRVIEFAATSFPAEGFIRECNRVLQRENSGYRFIGSQLTPVTSEEEIHSIELALRSSDRFRTTSLHIQSALSHLGNRDAPDYRNCIKEAISAMEAGCQSSPEIQTPPLDQR
jgi:hypothetical protein